MGLGNGPTIPRFPGLPMTERTASAGQRYRPEIDGLRAVAVLAVILNHMEARWLPGGWLGVDIFFVISGYVITRSLAARPSPDALGQALDFWRRRIQRLLPALVVCVLVTGFLLRLVDPNPAQRLGVGWRALFGFSNFPLLRQATDYFGSPAALEPFLHTWSLGVEEQFYLLFPLLVVASGFGRGSAEGGRRLARWLVLLAAGSLGLFLWWSHHHPAAAWFMMPARFWELGAGCLLALAPADGWRVPPPAPVLVGLIACLWFPASLAAAAIPAAVVLTTLLIAGLAAGGGAYALLSHSAPVLIGRMSYSLYLWHWSVLTLGRWTVGSGPGALVLQGLAIAALGAASWRWIEEPLRRRRWTGRPLTTIALGLAMAGGSALALIGLARSGDGLYLGQRTPARPAPAVVKRCDGPKNFRLYVVGDSHANHFRQAMGILCQEQGIRGDVSSAAGMPYPVLTYTNPGIGQDSQHNLAARMAMEQRWREFPLPKAGEGAVVLALRSSLYFDAPPRLVPSMGQAEHRDPFSDQPISRQAALARWLEDLDQLVAAHPQSLFVLMTSTPEFPDLAPIDACTPQWFRPRVQARCLDASGGLERRQVGEALNRGGQALARRHPNLVVFDAFTSLCPPGASGCPRLRDGQPLYTDDNHLSEAGAVLVLEDLLQDLRQRGLAPSPGGQASVAR
jgi:peptidoglycan/LPS O-acetylase OafA/YrhL